SVPEAWGAAARWVRRRCCRRAVRFFFFQAEDGIRGFHVTGVQTCALPISAPRPARAPRCGCPRAPSGGRAWAAGRGSPACRARTACRSRGRTGACGGGARAGAPGPRPDPRTAARPGGTALAAVHACRGIRTRGCAARPCPSPVSLVSHRTSLCAITIYRDSRYDKVRPGGTGSRRVRRGSAAGGRRARRAVALDVGAHALTGPGELGGVEAVGQLGVARERRLVAPAGDERVQLQVEGL